MCAQDETKTLEMPGIAVARALVVLPDDATLNQPQPNPDQAVRQPSSTEILKVSTRSRPSAVAGAIAGVLRQRTKVEVQCIGAGATNQAVKAIAIAYVYLRDDGINVGCVPYFTDVVIDGEQRSGLRLLVERR